MRHCLSQVVQIRGFVWLPAPSRQGLCCRHVIPHPDGHLWESPAPAGSTVGTGESEGSCRSEGQGWVTQVPLRRPHRSRQGTTVWGTCVFPLADTAGSVNAGGLLNSPGWEKEQYLPQIAAAVRCQALCPRTKLSLQHDLATQVALHLKYSHTFRVYNSAFFVELQCTQQQQNEIYES